MADQPARGGSGVRDALRGNREALIRYARLADAGEEIAIARDLLADGWTEVPDSFANLVAHLHLAAPDQWEGLADDVLVAVEREGIGEKTRAVIDALLAFDDQDELRRRVAWSLAERAQPGDARLMIDAFHRAIAREPDEPRASARSWGTPLAVWLVQKGGAELRRAEAGIPVALLHVIDLLRREAPEHLVSALDLLATSEHPQAGVLNDAPGERLLFPALEEALGRGLPEQWVEEILGGAFAILGSIGTKRFFVGFDPAGPYPRLGAALHLALAHGKWAGGAGIEAWMLAFEHAPRELPFTDAGLEAAFGALIWARTEMSRFPEGRIEEWAEALTAAWFKRFGLTRPRPGMLGQAWSPDVFAFEPELAPGIARALRRELARAARDPALDVARQLAEQALQDPRFASVALLTLPTRPRGGEADPDHGLTIDAVAEHLTSICRHAWDGPIAGIRVGQLLRGAQEVCIEDLSNDLAIDFRGDRIISANEKTYRDMWAKCMNPDEALAVSALYFVHEVIHVLQGIQRKAMVTGLRANASEPTLADLDLAADDLSARVVAVATGLSLAYLKDLEARATEAFPATHYHTGASVARKSSRLVGLRVDALLRGRVVPVERDGYASVLMPFSEGDMQVMWNARVPRLLGTIRLKVAEADLLRTAARPGRPPGELDRLLVDVVKRLVPVEDVHMIGLE